MPTYDADMAKVARQVTPNEMRQTIIDLCDVLDDYLKYAKDMSRIGRGFSTTDKRGRGDVSVLAGARAIVEIT